MLLNALTAFDDNYIWCLSDEAGRAIVVDPGDAAPVFAAAADGLVPVAVLLTHHHHDHVGGVAALLAHWPELEVLAPADARIPAATRHVHDGECIRVLDTDFEVLAVPGHTSSHVAFAGDGTVFCGDTLFSLGCGRMFEGTPAQMLASLQRLAALDGSTRVCCGHEYTLSNAAFALAVDPHNVELQAHTARARQLRAGGQPTLPSTMADERACNPFLRCSTPAVRQSIESRLGRAPIDDVDVFAALRHWKDGFRA